MEPFATLAGIEKVLTVGPRGRRSSNYRLWTKVGRGSGAAEANFRRISRPPVSEPGIATLRENCIAPLLPIDPRGQHFRRRRRRRFKSFSLIATFVKNASVSSLSHLLRCSTQNHTDLADNSSLSILSKVICVLSLSVEVLSEVLQHHHARSAVGLGQKPGSDLVSDQQSFEPGPGEVYRRQLQGVRAQHEGLPRAGVHRGVEPGVWHQHTHPEDP